MQEDYEIFESLLIENARSLNDIGKKKLLDTSTELLMKEKYRKAPSVEELLADMKLMEDESLWQKKTFPASTGTA